MTEFIIWVLLSYGLTNIMVYGSIFQGLRDFFQKWGQNRYAPFSEVGVFIHGILKCPMCFSTWSGFFLGLIVYSPSWQFLDVTPMISWFFDGLISSGSVWAVNSIVEWFEENRPKNS